MSVLDVYPVQHLNGVSVKLGTVLRDYNGSTRIAIDRHSGYGVFQGNIFGFLEMNKLHSSEAYLDHRVETVSESASGEIKIIIEDQPVETPRNGRNPAERVTTTVPPLRKMIHTATLSDILGIISDSTYISIIAEGSYPGDRWCRIFEGLAYECLKDSLVQEYFEEHICNIEVEAGALLISVKAKDIN